VAALQSLDSAQEGCFSRSGLHQEPFYCCTLSTPQRMSRADAKHASAPVNTGPERPHSGPSFARRGTGATTGSFYRFVVGAAGAAGAGAVGEAGAAGRFADEPTVVLGELLLAV
jgi:hypothetical protein